MEARNGNPLNLQALITERNNLHGNIKNASRRLQYRLNFEASLTMVTADFLKDHRRDISVLVDKAVATNIQVGIMIKQLFPPGDQTPYRSFFWQTEEWEEKVLHDWATLAERIDGAVAEIQRIGEKGGQGSYQAIFPHFPSSPLISLASNPNQVEAASAFQLSTLLPSQKDQSSSTPAPTLLQSSLGIGINASKDSNVLPKPLTPWPDEAKTTKTPPAGRSSLSLRISTPASTLLLSSQRIGIEASKDSKFLLKPSKIVRPRTTPFSTFRKGSEGGSSRIMASYTEENPGLPQTIMASYKGKDPGLPSDDYGLLQRKGSWSVLRRLWPPTQKRILVCPQTIMASYTEKDPGLPQDDYGLYAEEDTGPPPDDHDEWQETLVEEVKKIILAAANDKYFIQLSKCKTIKIFLQKLFQLC